MRGFVGYVSEKVGYVSEKRETGLKRVMVPCSGNKDGREMCVRWARRDARLCEGRTEREREREQSHSQGKSGVTLPLIANSMMNEQKPFAIMPERPKFNAREAEV